MENTLEVETPPPVGGIHSRKRKQPEDFPAFASILSFLLNYALLLGCVGEIDITKLSDWFKNNQDLSGDFVDFMMNLMKRMQRRATKDNWQEAVAGIYRRVSEVDSWVLRSYGFQKLSTQTKLSITKYLLECQFDSNEKFRVVIETLPAEDMRMKSLGSDECGNVYWFFQDYKCNILLYKEEPDDGNEDSFTLLAKSIEQFTCILTKLENHDFTLLDIKDEQISPCTISDAANTMPCTISDAANTIFQEKGQVEEAKEKNAINGIAEEKDRKIKQENDVIAEKNEGVGSSLVSPKEDHINHTVANDSDIKNNSNLIANENHISAVAAAKLPHSSLNEDCKVEIKTPKKEYCKDSGDGLDGNKEHNSCEEASSGVICANDFEKRRSSRISRGAKNFYSVEETFRLIYSQTQVTPPSKLQAKEKSVSVDNESSKECASDVQSEDIVLSKLAAASNNKKKGGRNNKKRRKSKKKGVDEVDDQNMASEGEDDDEEEIFPGEEGYEGCKYCLKKSRPDTILMCDICDSCIHMACLRPPLFAIPSEQWYCPACCHNLLLDALRTTLLTLQQQVTAVSRRRRYAADEVPFGFPSVVSLPNNQPPLQQLCGSNAAMSSYKFETIGQRISLREKTHKVNYGYDQYDQQIKAAIKAHNSPVKFLNSGTSSTDSATANDYGSDTGSNCSHNKYSMRSSSRRLKFNVESGQVVTSNSGTDDEAAAAFYTCSSSLHISNNHHQHQAQKEKTHHSIENVNYEQPLSSQPPTPAETAEENKGLESDSPAAPQLDDFNVEKVFSGLIAETSFEEEKSSSFQLPNERQCTTADNVNNESPPRNNISNSSLDHSKSTPSSSCSSPTQPKSNIIKNHATIAVSKYRSPVKVGKQAKLNAVRKMHDNQIIGNEADEAVVNGERVPTTEGFAQQSVNVSNRTKESSVVENGKMSSSRKRGGRSHIHSNDDYYYGQLSSTDSGSESETEADKGKEERRGCHHGEHVQINGKRKRTTKRSKYYADDDYECSEDENDDHDDEQKSSPQATESSEEEFRNDSVSPWKRKRKSKKDLKNKHRSKPVLEPARVSSRLSGQNRVKYSDDPFGGMIE